VIESVTDIIATRARRQDGLKAMVVWSAAGHAVLIAVLAVTPGPRYESEPRTVMTISLGGPPGPPTGGRTPAGGRVVQEAAPPKPQRALTSPAPPPVTVPAPRPRTQSPPRPQQAPREAAARAPSIGDEVRAGSTRAETGARGQGFGLSAGGGGFGGVTLDVANFCCPEYLELMVTAIRRNWVQNQGIVGTTTLKFTIHRDGSIRDVQVERSSGFPPLDLAAQRALLVTRQLPPLPSAYPNSTLTVHMIFEYSG
jgi:TonB family protein